MKTDRTKSLACLLGLSLVLLAIVSTPLHAAPLTLTKVKNVTIDTGRKMTTTIDQRININTATMEELMTIPGIGPKTSENIVQYRSQIGQFRSVEDLLNVKGIGPKTLEKIRPFVGL